MTWLAAWGCVASSLQHPLLSLLLVLLELRPFVDVLVKQRPPRHVVAFTPRSSWIVIPSPLKSTNRCASPLCEVENIHRGIIAEAVVLIDLMPLTVALGQHSLQLLVPLDAEIAVRIRPGRSAEIAATRHSRFLKPKNSITVSVSLSTAVKPVAV